MTVNGIDVANYQSSDYPTSGLDFAFVKATEGHSYTNPKHADQIATARKAGLVVGHYHFQRPGSSPATQTAYFLKHAKPKAGDLLACDWEDPGVSNADKDAFIRAVQRAAPGLRVGLYCNRSYWLTRDDTSVCGDFLWIADPSAPKGKPRVQHPWAFHQYAIAGGMDRNVGNFPDRAALERWAGSTKEDPMDIFRAVWRTDGEMPAGSTEPNPKNKSWIAETFLTRTFENTVQLLAQARHNGSMLSALDSKAGTTATLSDAQVQAIVTGLATDQRFVGALADAFADRVADRLQS